MRIFQRFRRKKAAFKADCIKEKSQPSITRRFKMCVLTLEVVYVFLSDVVGYIIFSSAALFYINQLLEGTSEKILTVGVTAFGLTAALSGLCFRMAMTIVNEDDKQKILYSGEKLLHACVLLIQTIFLKYVKDNLAKGSWGSTSWLGHGLNVILNVVIFLISISAIWSFLYGFETLHDYLWRRFSERKNSLKE